MVHIKQFLFSTPIAGGGVEALRRENGLKNGRHAMIQGTLMH